MSAKYTTDPRFEPHEDPLSKIFDIFPAEIVVREWKEHVRLNGRPDTFRLHCHTPPRFSDEVPEIIAHDLDVPEHLRASLGEAPCPLCSLRAPKYFHGMIAWWPREKALRAIGRECGKKIYGEGWNASMDRAAVRKSDHYALDFLIMNLAKISEMRSWAIQMTPRIKDLDAFRFKFVKLLTKAVAAQIYRASSGDALLYTFRTEWVPALDQFGRKIVEANGQDRLAPEPIADSAFRLRGRGILSPKEESAHAFVVRAANTVEAFSFKDDDEAELALMELEAAGRIAAETTLVQAAKLLTRAHATCLAVQQFCDEANIANLARWVNSTSTVATRMELDATGHLLVENRQRRAWFNLRDAIITNAVPTLPVFQLPSGRTQRSRAA